MVCKRVWIPMQKYPAWPSRALTKIKNIQTCPIIAPLFNPNTKKISKNGFSGFSVDLCHLGHAPAISKGGIP